MRKIEVEQSKLQTHGDTARNDNDSISMLFMMRIDEFDCSNVHVLASSDTAAVFPAKPPPVFSAVLCVFRFLLVVLSFYENVHFARVHIHTQYMF